ncbi:MaoC/PaaZ C-terminal domain-containing protein [Ancylobacter oerskovii]|uniref:MaoC/PaaZ C-terminal domain-containing protein n=1 Tax=Ancylobacter oerskovii TaxID=459519 RepID=A0ABW4Z4B7_9HYPH|nr:MaoC/PaaZ C-terminal domain-containing protein [Ancylobacter oerskovii]MBS7545780.1 MaoC family dehydratase N-terminal domain-containing protein [Ancylobacter oerskovii]
MLFWEDFHEGHVAVSGRYVVGREEIVAFARKYDPNPLHLDDAAAGASAVGGLCASGWHICAIAMRLLVDGVLANADCLGSPGVDEARFLAPVRPGTVLSLRRHILETRSSKSRPDMGIVKMRLELLDAGNRPVCELTGAFMLGRRNPGFRPA